MLALAVITLVFCVVEIMLWQGVGPFANNPWAKLHLSFLSLRPIYRAFINGIAILGSVVCSLILMGIIQWYA